MKNSYAEAGTGRASADRGYGDVRRAGTVLDGMVAAARHGWMKARSGAPQARPAPADSAQLRDAFRIFTDAADRLEGTYASLQARVEELSSELARTNADLTRELQDKRALAERQSALLAALPAGVVVVDARGVVREVNAAAARLLGSAPVGRSWVEAAAALVPAGSPFEWLTPGDDPRRVNLEDRIIDASGERIVLLYDITQAHAARVAQARNERLASMGEMAARLAHQLRTPLSTAMLYAGQLERPELTLSDRASLGEKIVSRLRSLERVTRDMLRFVRGEQAVEQRIEVSALLSEAAQVVAPLMGPRGIGFVCEDHAGGTVLRGDRRGLTAALLSLLENAAQATGQGGKVRVRAMANSARVRIQVMDNGAGIAADALPRVFEPFFSTRPDGTGLGLAIVKSVAETHGGSVEVESTPGVGTRFTLSLPCATEAAAQAALPPRVATSRGVRSDARTLDREAA